MLNKLEKRVVELTYKNNLTHLGSCLTAVGIIDKLYMAKKPEDKFVLSAGHCFLAQAVVLEKECGKDADELVKRHGTHPNRSVEDEIWVSTGSLGHGIGIALGMAIANPKIDIYVLSSDGEMAEGSCWEALRIAGEVYMGREEWEWNLKVAINANGYSALGKTDPPLLSQRVQMFFPSLVINTDLFDYPEWLQGVDAHYVALDEERYKELIK